jgi:thiamine-phosphate pyrophosphorylase
MGRCYSGLVFKRYPSVPRLWLISDARNDAALESALARLPRGSGLIFRHYHLPVDARRTRFRILARHARRFGHGVVLAGSAAQARRWGADGAYGSAAVLARGPAILRLVTAHSLHELAQARRARGDAVLLSPVYPTRSHPGGAVLGAVRFRLLAARAGLPVIALGGMNRHRAQALKPAGWAAIDGLST